MAGGGGGGETVDGGEPSGRCSVEVSSSLETSLRPSAKRSRRACWWSDDAADADKLDGAERLRPIEKVSATLSSKMATT